MPINMCACYCVSTSQFIWLTSFISWNMKQANCWTEMTSIESHVTLKHPRPGPHSEFSSCQCGCFRFQHLLLFCKSLATHRDHLGSDLVWVHVFCWQHMCVKERETEKEREMTDSLARLSAATRFPLRLLSCPGVVPLVSPNLRTPQVLFRRPVERPSDRETTKEKPGEKAEMKQGPISHVVLGSCLPPKT